MPESLPSQAALRPLPLRLLPGADLREALLALARERSLFAAFVVAGVGSLSRIAMRRAGAAQPDIVDGAFELLTLSGTVGTGGAHLHATVADASGAVSGGHVAPGCIVRTTAEILVVMLGGYLFGRVVDPATGYRELVISPEADDQA